MTSAAAIRRYLQEGEHGVPVAAGELVAFKKSMPIEEWHELGRQACGLLGEQHDVEQAK